MRVEEVVPELVGYRKSRSGVVFTPQSPQVVLGIVEQEEAVPGPMVLPTTFYE